MTKDLYVRNIPPEAGEEGVRKLFSVAGKVSYIHLVTDDRTGEFKGCGYVKMASEAEAKEAINCLDGARLEGGHILSVTAALPQKGRTGGQGDRPPAKTGVRPPARAGEGPKGRTGGRPSAKTGGRPKTGGRRK
jgi:hypothetical protein